MRPNTDRSSKIILRLSRDGLTAYCNKHAIIDLVKQLSWISESDPSEHFECHVLMTIENDDSKFYGSDKRNVGTVFADGLEKIFLDTTIDGSNFELTFMMAEDSDFEKILRD